MGGIGWKIHNIEANIASKLGKLEHNVVVVPIKHP